MNYPDSDTVPPVWQVGDVILDKYEVKEVFTGGGMGLVYRVHHREWAMDLAVKFLRTANLEQAVQEANFERGMFDSVTMFGLTPPLPRCLD